MQSALCNKWPCAAFSHNSVSLHCWPFGPERSHQAASSGIILLLQTLRNHHVIIILSQASINKYIWDHLSHFGGWKPHCGGRIKYFCLHFLLPLQKWSDFAVISTTLTSEPHDQNQSGSCFVLGRCMAPSTRPVKQPKTCLFFLLTGSDTKHGNVATAGGPIVIDGAWKSS